MGLIRKIFHGLLVLVLLGIVSVGIASARAPVLSCDLPTIQSVAPAGTTITSVAVVNSPVNYCDIKGSIATSTAGQNNTVLFELGLPDNWNSLYFFEGNGGFGGSFQAVDEGQFAGAISTGLATATTDAGHESPGPDGFLDGSFALSGGQPNLAARDDYAFRAVHVSTQVTQAIEKAYYDVSFMLAYFFGCSDGGREGLVEAQQFPTDYNGIVAGDPAIGGVIAGFNWNEQALLKSSAGYLSPADIQLLDQAVLAQCDGVDGVVDGLIQDPRQCHFDPNSLACTGSNSGNCLNSQKIKTVQAILSGAITNGNAPLYPGYMPSDPGGPDGWLQWITGFTAPQFGVAEPWGVPPASFAIAPFQWSFQDQFMKYFTFNDPNYNSLNFKFSNPSDVSTLNQATTQAFTDTLNPDLSAFFNAGGKLLIYHGWSDPALTPLATVNYYRSVAGRLYHGDLSQLQNNARLFMVPGMHHCGGGPGPNAFDPNTPLILWSLSSLGIIPPFVPSQITAVHFVDNDPSMSVDRSMPLCPYPQVASYLGGPVEEASSWACANASP